MTVSIHWGSMPLNPRPFQLVHPCHSGHSLTQVVLLPSCTHFPRCWSIFRWFPHGYASDAGGNDPHGRTSLRCCTRQTYVLQSGAQSEDPSPAEESWGIPRRSSRRCRGRTLNRRCSIVMTRAMSQRGGRRLGSLVVRRRTMNGDGGGASSDVVLLRFCS